MRGPTEPSTLDALSMRTMPCPVADIEVAGRVLHDGPDRPAIELRGSRHEDRLEAGRIQVVDAIDATRTPAPQPACAIGERSADVACWQTIRLRQHPETPPVIARDATIAKRDEHDALPVFVKAAGRVECRQAVGVRVGLKAAGGAIPTGQDLATRNEAGDPDVAP